MAVRSVLLADARHPARGQIVRGESTGAMAASGHNRPAQPRLRQFADGGDTRCLDASRVAQSLPLTGRRQVSSAADSGCSAWVPGLCSGRSRYRQAGLGQDAPWLTPSREGRKQLNRRE